MTLGRRIRELRVADPYMTQRELAAKVGVWLPYLSRIEAHSVKPARWAVKDIAFALEVEPYELLTLLDAWEPAPPFDISDASFVCGRRG